MLLQLRAVVSSYSGQGEPKSYISLPVGGCSSGWSSTGEVGVLYPVSTWASNGASVYVVREQCRCPYFLLILEHLKEYCNLHVFNKWSGFSLSYLIIWDFHWWLSALFKGKKVPQYFIWRTLKWLHNCREALVNAHRLHWVSCVSNRCTSTHSVACLFNLCLIFSDIVYIGV